MDRWPDLSCLDGVCCRLARCLWRFSVYLQWSLTSDACMLGIKEVRSVEDMVSVLDPMI